VVCVGTSQWLIDEAGRTIAPIKPPSDDAGIQQVILQGHGAICHPSAMMRAATVRQLGGYRREFYPAEDLDLWLRLGELGQLANLPEPLLRYRVHSGSISGQAAQGRQREAGRLACVDAWSRRGITDGTYEAGSAWRADETAASRMRFAVQYGWMAYTSGFRRTAIAYALKAIRLLPTKADGWRLLAIALFRRPGAAVAA
jgi:hypothetical protein